MRLPSWAFSWREVAIQYTACVLMAPLYAVLWLCNYDGWRRCKG